MDKFNGLHDKGRSKHWQNIRSLAGSVGKPVPHAKSSKAAKRKAAAELAGSAAETAVANPKKRRIRWRGAWVSTSKAAVKGIKDMPDAVASADALDTWMGQSVRVISDKGDRFKRIRRRN